MNGTSRDMLRHALATLAYRSRKILSDVPDNFSTFKAAPRTRRPGRILAHMGDLMDWALSMSNGAETWQDSKPLEWPDEVGRFYASLAALDVRLASAEPLATGEDRLFQGPVADALWHLGQLALLRGMVEAPIKSENYARAEVVVGRVGPDQAPPRREF